MLRARPERKEKSRPPQIEAAALLECEPCAAAPSVTLESAEPAAAETKSRANRLLMLSGRYAELEQTARCAER